MKQLVKRRSAMRKAATIAKVKTWKMTEKLKVSTISTIDKQYYTLKKTLWFRFTYGWLC